MSKQLKTLITESLQSRFEGVDEACVVDVTGLSVEHTMAVRNTLSTKEMRLMVVKNSLARRAFVGGPLAPLGRDLRGPCAFVTGSGSVIDVAREMVDLAKTYPAITLKRGILSGDSEVTEVAALAKLKGKAELMGEIACLLASPGRAIAGCLSSPAGKIAGCLKAMADCGEES